MSIFISKGNKKVQASIFNLPSGITCKKCLKCSNYCYAKKAERLYKQVLPCRKNNLKESKKNSFITQVQSYIDKNKPQYFRIHESGDFYSQAYFKLWCYIAEKNPCVIFYTYTKRDDILSKQLLNSKPNNLIIYFSIDGIKEPDTTKDMEALLRALNLGYNGLSITTNSLGTCPAQKNNDVKCMKNCFKCIHCNNVVYFKKH